MLSEPLVSVVVPVYNGEQFLAAALASIFDQDYRRLEVIVVDDGSTDATASITQATPGVLYLHQDQRGPAAARNAGISVSTGAYLAFLDADDMMKPRKLRHQVDFLQAHPEVGCVFGHEELLIEPGAPLPNWARPGGLRSLRLGEAGPIPPSSMVATRETFDRVGSFDESFSTGEDLDWVLRLQESGIGMHVLDEVVLIRRIHRASMTQAPGEPHGSALKALHARVKRRRSR